MQKDFRLLCFDYICEQLITGLNVMRLLISNQQKARSHGSGPGSDCACWHVRFGSVISQNVGSSSVGVRFWSHLQYHQKRQSNCLHIFNHVGWAVGPMQSSVEFSSYASEAVIVHKGGAEIYFSSGLAVLDTRMRSTPKTPQFPSLDIMSNFVDQYERMWTGKYCLEAHLRRWVNSSGLKI